MTPHEQATADQILAALINKPGTTVEVAGRIGMLRTCSTLHSTPTPNNHVLGAIYGARRATADDVYPILLQLLRDGRVGGDYEHGVPGVSDITWRLL